MSESPIAARPAEPFADVKARAAAAVEAARDEILDLSHRIHANPEPAFEEHQAAAWVAEAVAAPRVRGGASRPAASRRPSAAGSPAAWARTGRGSACSPSTTRCRASATAAATTRWRRPASAPPSRSRRSATSGPARSCSWAPRPRSGGAARRSCSATACSRASTPRSCYHPCDRNHVEIAPLASEDVTVVFTGLQSHAASDPWEGRNALDAMIALFVSVGLWRQQLPPHCRVHGIIQEGGTAANIIPDRTRAWFMIRSADQPFYDEIDEAALPRAVRGGRARRRRRGRGRVLGLRVHDEAQPRPRGTLGRQRRGVRHRATRAWTRRRARPTWPTSRGPCRRSTRSSRSPTCPRPATRSSSATPPRRPRADRTVLLASTLVAQTALDLLLDPALADAAWREFRGEA